MIRTFTAAPKRRQFWDISMPVYRPGITSFVILSHKHFNHIPSKGLVTQMTLWIILCNTKMFLDLFLDSSTRCSQISTRIVSLFLWRSCFVLALTGQRNEAIKISSCYLTYMFPYKHIQLVSQGDKGCLESRVCILTIASFTSSA